MTTEPSLPQELGNERILPATCSLDLYVDPEECAIFLEGRIAFQPDQFMASDADRVDEGIALVAFYRAIHKRLLQIGASSSELKRQLRSV